MQLNKKISFLFFLVAVISAYSCKKKSSPPPPTIYTPKLAGMHSWRGIIIHHWYNVPIDSVDTVNYSFAITVVNDSLIKIGNYPIPFYSFNNTELFYQVDFSYSNHYLQTNNYFAVTYNYLNNTLTYDKIIGSVGIYQDTSLSSP